MVDWELRGRFIAKGYKGAFGGDGNPLNLSCCGGYTGIYICHQTMCLTLFFINYISKKSTKNMLTG